MTTQILPTEKLYAGQFTKSEWLQLTPEERREISYKRYLQNVANAPKVNYDSLILGALYEIMYYISNGLFEAFSVVKGDVTANVIVRDENDFVIKIQTPTQYLNISDDKDLFFTKKNIKVYEKLVGAKVFKKLKTQVTAEIQAKQVETINEPIEMNTQPTNQNETMQPAQPQTLEVNQVIQCDGYRLVVTAIKKETSFDTVANFAKMNKNEELADYYTECATGDYSKQKIKVLGVLSVNDKVFNELSNNLLSSWTIANLEKFGGSESNDPRLEGVESFYKMTQQQQEIYKNTYYLLCLQVTNVETNETFYIDSQGYSYARYVGLPEIDYSQRAKVQSEYNERQPENELQKIETEPGVWHLSNQYTSINVDLNDNGVTGRDLTDLNNMPTFYNKTKKSFKKAFQALLAGFNENTKMYDAARLMAPYIRIRSYFAMD